MILRICAYTHGNRKETDWPQVTIEEDRTVLTTEPSPMMNTRDSHWMHKEGRFNYSESAKVLEDLIDWFELGVAYYNETGTLPQIHPADTLHDRST